MEEESLKVRITQIRKLLDSAIEADDETVLLKESLLKLSCEMDDLIVEYMKR